MLDVAEKGGDGVVAPSGCCDSSGDVLVAVQRELHSQVAAGECPVDAGDDVDGDGDNEQSALAAMMMAAQGGSLHWRR